MKDAQPIRPEVRERVRAIVSRGIAQDDARRAALRPAPPQSADERRRIHRALVRSAFKTACQEE